MTTTPIIADTAPKIHPADALRDQISELAKQGDPKALLLHAGMEYVEGKREFTDKAYGRAKANSEAQIGELTEESFLRLQWGTDSPRGFGIHIQDVEFHYDSDVDTPGAKVARIRLRICEDSAQDGRPESIDLKSRDDLASQTKFLAAYAEMSGVMPARRKNAEWQEVLGAIFANIDPIYPGDSRHGDDTLETSHWVNEYIEDHTNKNGFVDLDDTETFQTTPEDLAIKPVDGKWPFKMDGNRYVFLENLRLWIDDHKGVKLTPQDLAIKLKDAGYNRTVLRMGGYQRRVWVEYPLRKAAL